MQPDSKSKLESFLIAATPDLLLPMSFMEGGAPAPKVVESRE
jgi:hypothetical protein